MQRIERNAYWQRELQIGYEVETYKRIDVGGNLDNDSKTLSDLKKVDGVILVSKLWDTDYDSLQRQIDIVKNAEKNVVGVIGLE